MGKAEEEGKQAHTFYYFLSLPDPSQGSFPLSSKTHIIARLVQQHVHGEETGARSPE